MDCFDKSGTNDFDFLIHPRPETFTIFIHDFGQAPVDMDPRGRETYVIDDLCYPKETCCGEDLDRPCPPPPQGQDTYGRGRQPDAEIFGFSKERPKRPEKEPEPPSTPVLNSADCCSKDNDHTKTNRRFLLQFTRTGMAAAKDRTDHCYAAERDRCLDFWNFVRNHTELDKCIKDGSFFHKGRLIRVDCAGEGQKKSIGSSSAGGRPISKMNVPSKKYTPSMEALKRRNDAIHEEEKQRKERAHKRWLQLARKSGQDFNMESARKILGKKIVVKKPPRSCEFSDCQKEDIGETMKEMDRFDEMSNYPVQGNCMLRQMRRPSLECTEPMMKYMLPEIEYKGETEYYGEDDTGSSSAGTATSQFY